MSENETAKIRVAMVDDHEMFPDSTCKCNGWFRVGLF